MTLRPKYKIKKKHTIATIAQFIRKLWKPSSCHSSQIFTERTHISHDFINLLILNGQRAMWSWSYGSCINNYAYTVCELDTILYDKVCQ
jgi:hypothetical protein